MILKSCSCGEGGDETSSFIIPGKEVKVRFVNELPSVVVVE